MFIENPTGSRSDLVELDQDHPGFRDEDYRRRRNAIAKLAQRHRDGDEVPSVPYTPEEETVWRQVCDTLRPLHEQYACRAYWRAASMTGLLDGTIPQLREVNRSLKAATGFSLMPVAGLVSGKVFLTYLARDVFLATQYVRHHSKPFYTPEPDVIHELVGHAVTFVDPVFAELSRAFGARLLKDPDDDELALRLIRAYWYTLEFGLVEEGGKLRVYGAGLLSSVSEINRFEQSGTVRRLDLDVVAETPFDPTTFQETYFVAPSFRGLVPLVTKWVNSQ